MQTNRPRESVLHLFDPLARPETPPRNTGSPDSASDKENDNPKPGQLTVLFNRVYSHAKPSIPSHGKLIDFGDVSMSDMMDVHGDASGDDENAPEADEQRYMRSKNTEEAESSSLTLLAQHRLPLAEIKLEKAPPLGVRLPPTIDEDSEPSDSANTSLELAAPPMQEESTAAVALTVNTAPYGTPLADVINSINLSAISLSDSQHPQCAEQKSGSGRTDDLPDDVYPGITVCPPEEDLHVEVATSNATSPAVRVNPASTSHLSPATSILSGPIRRHGASTGINDPRRASVDLHSSFSLHLQSSEMSFDLLNDKISFLAQGNDSSYSFWPGMSDIDIDEDTFDLAKAQLRVGGSTNQYLKPAEINVDEDTFDLSKEKQKIEALAQKYGSIHEERFNVVKEAANAATSNSPKLARAAEKEASAPRVFSLPPKASTQQKAASSVVDAKQSAMLPPLILSPPPKEKPVAEQTRPNKARASLTAPRSSSGAPAVPALRIVKKAVTTDHERTSSGSSSASTTRSWSRPPSVASSRAESDGGDNAVSCPGVKLPKPVSLVKGVQRPPPGAALPAAPTRPTLLRTLTLGSKRAAQASSAPAVPSAGLARPTASSAARTTSVQRPTTVSSIASKVSVPRSNATVIAEKPSGMRAPSRFPSTVSTAAPTATLPSRSGLPRPASRLPGPPRVGGTTSLAKTSGLLRRAT